MVRRPWGVNEALACTSIRVSPCCWLLDTSSMQGHPDLRNNVLRNYSFSSSSSTGAKYLEAKRPDHVWALNFEDDQTSDGRRIRILNVVDEFTREVLAVEVARSITADKTVEVLEELLETRGTAPSFIRMDNGPELTSYALADWCRFSGTGAGFIEPGSPWQNPYVESLNSRIRDELLNQELFHTLLEAQVLAEDWRVDHNRNHPHSALGMLSPDEFAAIWRRSGTTTATPTP